MRFPAVVLLCVVALVGCGADGPEPRPTPSAPTATSTPTPDPEPTPTEPVTFDDEEGLVRGDTVDLPGAPAEFESFLASELAAARADSPGDCGAPEYRVTAVDPGGWAAGTFFRARCDGYAVLWAADPAWSEVWSGQTLYDCATLERHRFPTAVAGTSCFDGTAQVTYPR